MKRQNFQAGTLFVEYSRERYGPPNSYVCCYKGRSWLLFDSDKVRKTFKLSKGTPTRERFDAWLEGLTMADQDEPATGATMVL